MVHTGEVTPTKLEGEVRVGLARLASQLASNERSSLKTPCIEMVSVQSRAPVLHYIISAGDMKYILTDPHVNLRAGALSGRAGEGKLKRLSQPLHLTA